MADNEIRTEERAVQTPAAAPEAPAAAPAEPEQPEMPVFQTPTSDVLAKQEI